MVMETMTMTMTMTEGDVVKVYEDPITCEVFEGEAKLVSCFYENAEVEQWHVVFTDDVESGTMSRAINKINH